MSQLRYIGSGALGALLVFSQQMSSHGGKALIAAPQESVRKMLKHLSMHKVMPIFESLDEALAS